MIKSVTLSCVAVAVGLYGVNTYAAPVKKSNINIEKRVITSSKVGVSKRLSDIHNTIPVLSKHRKAKLQASGETIPGITQNRVVKNYFPFESQWSNAPKVVDTALQSSISKQLKTSSYAPNIGVSFDGVGNVLGVAPPDTNGDVGPNHYVQTVKIGRASCRERVYVLV